MQIVEISEPGSIDKSSENEIVVGIDFGTTNSLIAISDKKDAKIIPMQGEGDLLASIVGVRDNNGQIIVGKNANKCVSNIRSIKRLLGKSSSEIKSNPNLLSLSNSLSLENDIPKILFGGKAVDLVSVASEIFKCLKNQAQENLNKDVKKAVVSVPAYFDDIARGQVLLAAKLANLEVIRLVAEPTAAAYAYGLNNNVAGSYLVYDLGGGTFDVSVLNMQEGILQVIATGGDAMLGGDDFDMLLAYYIADLAKIEVSQKVISIAKSIKEQLSSNSEVSVNLEDVKIVISRKIFEEITSSLIKKTITIVKETLNEIDEIDLDGIILVGGSTRMPIINESLERVFNVPIHKNLDADKVVALGAAMQAENLSVKSNSLLLDVTPLSLGLELYGGLVEKIIMRNTSIPFSVSKEFTTHVDNQTGIKFHIVQGEREMVGDCRSLAHFELKGIKPNKAGKARVEVIFAIDGNGILSVSANDAGTGVFHSVEVRPSYGLSQEDIVHDLHDAFKNAECDHDLRLLAEAKKDADSLVLGMIAAIEETPDLLTQKERKAIDNAINSLQMALNLDNREDILFKTKDLNDLASGFMQKHLDKGADLLLKNRHIDDL